MGDSAVLRPAPSGSGTLAKTPLLHLLVYVHDRKLTGTVELVTADKRGTASIRFIAGEPAKVRTNAPSGYLGQVLCELGFLTERQNEDSIADLQTAKAAGRALHGQILLEKRIIDRRQLEAGLREQVGRKLRVVAAMPPDTMYGFYDGFDGLRGWAGDVDQGYDLLPMLAGVLAASPPLDHVTAGLAKIGAAELRLVKNSDIGRFALDAGGRAVVEVLRARPSKVADLVAESRVAESRVDERAVHLATYLLLVTKQVEVLRGDSQKTMSVSPPSAARPSTVSSGSHVPVMKPVTSSSPPGGTPKGSPSGRMAAVLPPPPTSLAPDLAARWQDIVSRATSIDRADYFMMLEVARDAPREEIEAAFFALAKVWHPDRLPAELAPVRDACSRVFSRMSEAHASLTDDEKRKHYMTLLADGSGSPETQETVAKVIEAATDFQKAEVCFKRNDMTQAELWCRKAAEGDSTQPNYRALLAWITALKPENQSLEKTLESIKVLDVTLKQNERAESAHLWRGLLFKRIGKDELAMRDFKRAVELNPKNIDAAREVRLFTMRASRPSMPPLRIPDAGGAKPDGEKQGLLGRLFKK
jgi:tetratricopeptide (TPR) repeat protein